MKKLLGLLSLLLLLIVVTTASASPDSWWQLGYRPQIEQLVPRTVKNPERYHLSLTGFYTVKENPDRENVRVWLPLPADDAYQRVFVSRLSPAPKNLLKSRYGYQIAYFDFGLLKKGETFLLNYEAEVELGEIRWSIMPRRVGKLNAIPEQIRRDYLADSPMYAINDPAIIVAAREAVGEEKNPLRMMARIAQYVRLNLVYELDGKKASAPKVLAQGHGSCTEYSFAMIAMARQMGIPARYMAGSLPKTATYRPQSYDRVFHKIVEIYLPRIGWVPVESTGGRWRAATNPEALIGFSSHRMLFFTHEPEPGLAPLDPRRNVATYIPFNESSRLKIKRHLNTDWRLVQR